MASNLERLVGNPINVGHVTTSGGTRTGLALNAEFINATSGPVIAVRYEALVASTIDALYLFMDDSAGTLGNISITVKIYNENATLYRRTGTTERWPASGGGVATTTMPDAADKWIKVDLSVPYTTAVGEIIWICASNGATDRATDYPTILYSTTMQNSLTTQGDFGSILGYYSSSGFSTNGTFASELPFVIKHGSIYVGSPWTRINTAYYTSNQLERGIQFTPTEDVTVVSVEFPSGVTVFSDARLLADATAPGGTALYTWDLDSDSNETTAEQVGAKTFDTAVTLTGGTTYKLTFTYGSNSQIPYVMEIEDYASYSSMFDTLRGYDTFKHPWGVIDDGASGWTIQKAVCPSMGLKVSDFPLQSSGSGGLTASIGSPLAG